MPCSMPAQEALPFFEERSHPRLWRMFGSACLQQQALDLAAHAFVACKDFVVHPEHHTVLSRFSITSCVDSMQRLHVKAAGNRGSMQHFKAASKYASSGNRTLAHGG